MLMGRIRDGVLNAIMKDVHGNVVQFVLGEASPCDKEGWPRKTLHNYDCWLISESRRGWGTGNLPSLILMLNY